MRNIIFKILLSPLLVCFFSMGLIAQSSQKLNNTSAETPLRVGQLENGLTYYIYKDSTFQSDKVLMGFIVKAGSNRETEAEREFAHMLEHIPFVRDSVYPEGIDRFLKYDMVPFLDVSARTSFTHVPYWFHYPPSHPEAYEAGLSWFREIASELLFTDNIMDRVRSQVQGEILFRARTVLQCVACIPYIRDRLYGRGEYDWCNHVNNLENNKKEDLQAFYKRWYIPGNMGLFVVGPTEMSVEQIVADIQDRFGELKQPNTLPEEIDYTEMYLSRENQYINIDTRGLLELPEVQLHFRRVPPNHIRTVEQLRLALLDEMVGNLVNSHINNRSQSLDNPDIESIVFQKDENYSPSFLVTPKLKQYTGIKKGIQLPVIEFRKVLESGFTDEEFSKAVDRMEHKYITKQEQSAQQIIDELYEHFLRDNGFLPDEKTAHIRKILATVTKQDLELRLQALFNPDNKVDVVIQAPDEQTMGISKSQVYDWLAEAWKTPIAAWETNLRGPEKESPKPIQALLSRQEQSKLRQTTGYEETENAELGLTEMVLPNGIRVVLKPFKPTSGFKDRLQIKMFKPGGASRFQGSDYATALYAADIVKESGFEGYSRRQLDIYMKRSWISPFVNHTDNGFLGEIFPEQLEESLQYLYLYITRPRVDAQSLSDWKKKQKMKLLTEQRNTDLLLQNLKQNYFEGRPIVEQKAVELINKKSVLELYPCLFTNPQGYTVVLTGDFDRQKAMELFSKYMGAIPNHSKSRVGKPMKNSMDHIIPKGPQRIHRESNDPRKSDIEIVYSGRLEYSAKEDTGLYVLNMLFNNRLNNRLRNEEENSTVYFVFSTYDLFDKHERYKLTIKFNCVNSKRERMIAAIKDEIEKLKAQGPDVETLKNVLANIKIYDMPIYKGDARYMINQLVDMYKYNTERVPIYMLAQYIQDITVSDIRELAQKYLNDANYYEFMVRENIPPVENSSF
ncbi:M16 family metallopeptidase [Sinomicrobium oceani]|uniref:M16 family metallopeptidase n=1 Tax=Sinomicrobium oceani TaxID=1150368 RepID=UPI00227AB424|nr:insulinase family protein [Sinomicrobium oceani]